MNRALLSVVLVNLTVALTGTATNNDCDVSVCMKQSTWPEGGQGQSDQWPGDVLSWGMAARGVMAFIKT